MGRTGRIPALAASAVLLLIAAAARAETGYDLWLRYVPVTDAARRDAYRSLVSAIVLPARTPTADVTAEELHRGLSGMLGVDVPRTDRQNRRGAVIVGTPA